MKMIKLGDVVRDAHGLWIVKGILGTYQGPLEDDTRIFTVDRFDRLNHAVKKIKTITKNDILEIVCQ